MAISVVYTIRKIGAVDIKDIVVHSDEYWLETSLVAGGIRSVLEKQYPPEEYGIVVSVITHPGTNDD